MEAPEPSGKAYETDEVTVYFDAAVCQHSGGCVRGLPDVFEVGRRPWIVPENASADEVAAQIERCPSGALQYRRPQA